MLSLGDSEIKFITGHPNTYDPSPPKRAQIKPGGGDQDSPGDGWDLWAQTQPPPGSSVVPPSLSVSPEVLVLVWCVPEPRFPPAFGNLPSRVGVGVQTLAQGGTGLHGPPTWWSLAAPFSSQWGYPIGLWPLVAPWTAEEALSWESTGILRAG